MRIMAIDYGDAHTGIAISDPTGFLTGTTTTIHSRKAEEVAGEIARLVQEHGVEELVMGYPRNMDGTEGPRAELYRDGVRDESFNGVTVSEPGNYQLFVYDKAGNMSSARFQMRYKMNLAAVMAIVLVILIAGAVVVYVKKVKRDVSVR